MMRVLILIVFCRLASFDAAAFHQEAPEPAPQEGGAPPASPDGPAPQDAPPADGTTDEVHPLDLLETELRDPDRAGAPDAGGREGAPGGPTRARLDFGPITLLAASSLKRALDEADRDLERLLNRSIDIRYAPSTELVEALRAGGIDADVVALSDPSRFDVLAAEDRIETRTRRTFAWNSMIFVQGPGGKRRSNVRFTSGDWPTAARVALQFGRASDQKLVIVDPSTSTEGAAARRALVAAGLWEALADDLTIVADSAAAAQSLARGDATFGLIYGTTASLAPNIATVATVPLRETGLVRYQASALKAEDVHPDAWRLVEALRGPAMAPHLRRYGFLPPDEGRLSAAAQRDSILSDPLLDLFGDPDR